MRRIMMALILSVALASVAASGNDGMHNHPTYHHRATEQYVGPACEEDEVLWWVSDGVRSCMPLDDIQ